MVSENQRLTSTLTIQEAYNADDCIMEWIVIWNGGPEPEGWLPKERFETWIEGGEHTAIFRAKFEAFMWASRILGVNRC